MISLGTAIISTSTFREILEGTQQHIARSSWREILVREGGHEQIYVETACLCQALILISFIMGPSLGGALVSFTSMQQTCNLMGTVASCYCGVYLIFSIYLSHFARNEPQKPQSSISADFDFWRKKKQDDLGWFINELAD